MTNKTPTQSYYQWKDAKERQQSRRLVIMAICALLALGVIVVACQTVGADMLSRALRTVSHSVEQTTQHAWASGHNSSDTRTHHRRSGSSAGYGIG